MTWNGVRGLDSIGACAPGEAAEFHWILTPGGGNSVTSATLHVRRRGRHRDEVRQRCLALLHPRERDPGRGLAEVTGTLGRNALLTISDGCFGDGADLQLT